MTITKNRLSMTFSTPEANRKYMGFLVSPTDLTIAAPASYKAMPGSPAKYMVRYLAD